MTTDTSSAAMAASEQEQEDSQRDKYLTFLVDTEEYGIAINYVTEIIGLQQITAVPDLPESLKGVINLRGKIIPVMDMRSRFHLPTRDYDSRTCVVVVNLHETIVGLIVDRVSEVHNIPASQIEPPPRAAKGGCRYIQGIGKVGEQVTILLDIDALLHQDVRPELESMPGNSN